MADGVRRIARRFGNTIHKSVDTEQVDSDDFTGDGVEVSTNLDITFQSVSVTDLINLDPLDSAPSDPTQGDIVMADGINWNPGSGSGIYVYDDSGWEFLGGAGTT